MEQILRDAGVDLQNPSEDKLAKVADVLRANKRKGIWLVARTPLGIDQDDDEIIHGFDYFNSEDRQDKYLSSSGIIVGTRVESRDTVAAPIEETKESEPSEPDPFPIKSSPSDFIQRFTVQLRERLEDLPWRSGTYIVDVMLDTQTSNRVEFRLTAGLAAEKDPEVAKFIAAQVTSGDEPRKVYPAEGGGKYPNYKRNEESLEVPAENGISLKADRVAIFKPDGHSVLKGSFRLPVPAAFYSAAEGPVTATVPITLVITGNILAGPFVAALVVPTEDKVDKEAAESVVTGQFEIDLFALDETSKVPQTYSIWAYSGAVRSEIATAAFITPEMLK